MVESCIALALNAKNRTINVYQVGKSLSLHLSSCSTVLHLDSGEPETTLIYGNHYGMQHS